MESVKHITGEVLKNMFLFGAQNLRANEREVNDLNVFPIPDGDTGENMYLTIKGGVDAISGKDGNVEHISNEFSKGMLLNARGNSGVILSQMFLLCKYFYINNIMCLNFLITCCKMEITDLFDVNY